MNKFYQIIGTGAAITTPLVATISCENKNIDVGATVYTSSDTFTATITKGLKDELSKLGLSINLQGSQNDQTIQTSQIKAMISKGVKVLVINMADIKAGQPIIDLAKKANVPLILYNREAQPNEMNSYNKVYYLGPIGADSGKAQAEAIYKDLESGNVKDRNKDGKLIYKIIGGEAGHPDANARTIYVQSELRKLVQDKGINASKFSSVTSILSSSKSYIKVDSKYNVYIKQGITKMEVNELFGGIIYNPSDLQYTKWGSSGDTKSIISGIITSNKTKLDILMANADPSAIIAGNLALRNGFAKWTQNYAKSSNTNYLPIYGVNGGDDVIQEINNGVIAGSVFQDGYAQGKALAHMIKNLLDKKPIANGLDTTKFDTSELSAKTKAIRSKYVAVTRDLAKSDSFKK